MAIVFDNTAAKRLVRTTNLPATNRQSNPYTFMCWVYVGGSTGNFQCVYSLNNDTTAAMDWIGIDSSGNWNLSANSNNLTGSHVATTGTWYHVAAVRAANNDFKMYINGALSASGTLNAGNTTMTRLEVGGFRTTNADLLNGRVANIKIWGSLGLTLAEVQKEMYLIRPARFGSSLNGFYPTWSGTSRSTDYSGLGRNWTESGTLTDADDAPVSWGAEPFIVVTPGATPAPTDKPTSDSFAFSESAAVSSPLLDSLIYYFPLNEASGARTDAHGGIVLTDVNTVTGATGKLSTAAQFTRANNERLEAADSPTLSHGDYDFTYQAWIYPTTLGGALNRILNKNRIGATVANHWEIALDIRTTTGRLEWIVGNNAGSSLTLDGTTAGALALNAWHHVLAWHDSVADTLNLQVDGGTVQSGAYTFGSYDGDGMLAVGATASDYNQHYFDGRIDELARWNRVLTAIEREALYGGGAGLAYPFLPPADRAASDSATLTETAAVDRPVDASDAATLTDSAQLSAALTPTDGATLAESASVVQSNAVAATDALALTEAASLAVAPTGSDSASVVDTAASAAALSVSDAVNLTDAATVAQSNALSATDALALTDASAALAAAHTPADSAAALEVQATAAALAPIDSATLADAATVSTAGAVTTSDALTLTDSATLSAALTATDTATLADAATVALPSAVSVSDALALSEAASLAAASLATESATLTELASVAQTADATAADDGRLTESAALLAALLASDTLTLTESVSIGGDFVPITGLTPMHADLVTAGATDAELVTVGRTGAAFVTDGVTTHELVGV